VDRISEVALSERTFSPSADFNLQAYLKNELSAQPQFIARLRFEPEFVNILAGNHSYWETIETKADGSAEVTFLSPGLEWAASTTLAYGPAVEVLEPPELRVMVAEWLEAIARKYKS
jgi:predicted DNA-binding transcriptional regulator YafY